MEALGYRKYSFLKLPLWMLLNQCRREDKRDHKELAEKLLAVTGCPIAVANYRLTPRNNEDSKFWHPMHTQDMLAFLNFIIEWKNAPCGYDKSNIILLGHSCSAHMICSILMEAHQPLLKPSTKLLKSIKAVAFDGGLYNFDQQIHHFKADLDWYIKPAFGPPNPNYKAQGLSVLEWPLRPKVTDVQWLLIHSYGDTEVKVSQSQDMYNRLKSLGTSVEFTTEGFTQDHDAVLKSDVYVSTITNFFARLDFQPIQFRRSHTEFYDTVVELNRECIF